MRGGWLFDFGAWLSLGINRFILLGDYEPLCVRIGRSILYRTGAHRLPLPKWFRNHCIDEWAGL
jgi:hypothetical protein